MGRRRSRSRKTSSAAWVVALVAAAVVVAVLFTAQQRAAQEQDQRDRAAKARQPAPLAAMSPPPPAPFSAPPSSTRALAAGVEEPATGGAHFDVPPASPGLELLDHHPEPGKYCWYIVGRIRNNSDAAFGYVRVRAHVYDGAHKLIASPSDSTSELAAHEVWHFKIVVTDPEARGYRIAGISDTP
ncbi:MAG: FxLYD domain-containing protein [Chthonomonadales bacterium]